MIMCKLWLVVFLGIGLKLELYKTEVAPAYCIYQPEEQPIQKNEVIIDVDLRDESVLYMKLKPQINRLAFKLLSHYVMYHWTRKQEMWVLLNNCAAIKDLPSSLKQKFLECTNHAQQPTKAFFREFLINMLAKSILKDLVIDQYKQCKVVQVPNTRSHFPSFSHATVEAKNAREVLLVRQERSPKRPNRRPVVKPSTSTDFTSTTGKIYVFGNIPITGMGMKYVTIDPHDVVLMNATLVLQNLVTNVYEHFNLRDQFDMMPGQCIIQKHLNFMKENCGGTTYRPWIVVDEPY